MAEFNLSYTAEDINTKLGKIDTLEQDVNKLNNEKVDKTGISLGIGADGLIYIHVNGAPVGTGIERGASGDVHGHIDENNVIMLTGTLPKATYTFKFKMEDGTTVDIGELSFAPDGPINWADPTSEDWVTGYRLSTSTGGVKECAGHTVTNFIPAKKGDVLRVKGLNITGYVNSQYCGVLSYADDKTTYRGLAITGVSGSISGDGAKGQVVVDGDISTYTVQLLDSGKHASANEIAYIRIDGILIDGYTAEDVIITINEEIV